MVRQQLISIGRCSRWLGPERIAVVGGSRTAPTGERAPAAGLGLVPVGCAPFFARLDTADAGGRGARFGSVWG